MPYREIIAFCSHGCVLAIAVC